LSGDFIASLPGERHMRTSTITMSADNLKGAGLQLSTEVA